MDTLVVKLSRLDVVRGDLDYHLIRVAMVIVFLAFGYQKWFEYEAQALIPFISSGPLISWLYPAFGLRAQAISLASQNGFLARRCSWDFGTRSWGSLARSVRASPSLRPSQSFPSFRAAGQRRPAAFRRWPYPLLSS